MESVDCVVIGAGVVGLAVARKLALAGRRVVVLEAEAEVGRHTSSRNSGVIHAGMYYPTGSNKARLCVAGRQALYAYLAERDVPHRHIGKLLVAVRESEVPTLERIRRLGEANGVSDLITLSAQQLHSLEPAISAVRAVLSPSTGIVDVHALMHALRADLEAAGGAVSASSPVIGGHIEDDHIKLKTAGPAAALWQSKRVVNAAGLRAPSVANALQGPHRRFVPAEHYARGHYFALRQPAPVRHLIYPMPSPHAAHIHMVLDLAGRARFGPDISWSDEVSYAFDSSRAERFYNAITRYYPALAEGDLQPDIVGIRSKIVPQGAPAADFVIQGPEVHGAAGLIHLFGIESPGLTACLAIADEVTALLS